VKHPAVFGIDLTSTETKPSACLGLDDTLQLVYLGFLVENSDIIALMNFYSPEVIAIDAPLSLPLGLCCLEENCSCQPQFPTRKNRQCDQKLRQQGIPCYPTSKKTFIKDLIVRGMKLKTAIANEVKQPGQVIEVYPYASKVRLFGKTMPKKTTPQGIAFLKERLGDILPALRPYLAGFDHDLCDAAIAAYTAFLYSRNMVDALGNSEEGLIFIPC
jgi:predicted nuclease with RNAse H fold